MSTQAEHWESVYARKKSNEVSWYRPHLERSMSFVEQAGLSRDAAIIDVGGGAATFVDDLLERGFTDLTVLDISAKALDVAKQRLGPNAERVKWLVADVTRLELPESSIDFWHDRAVFHFLRDAEDRRRYVEVVQRALKPGGHIVVATFGPQGPEKCSGLEVMRYSGDELHAQFGGEFSKVDSLVEVHHTPGGNEQQFVYCYCRIQKHH